MQSNADVFIVKAMKVHGEKYSYNEVDYRKAKEKVTIICRDHGRFNQTPNSHLNGNGCPKCSCTSQSNTSAFIVKAMKVHGERYSYNETEYKKALDKVTIICRDHGKFSQTPSEHLKGHGCPICKRSLISLFQKDTVDDFVTKANNKHNGKYSYNKVDYVTSKVKVIITCKKHGDFFQTPASHLQGRGCPKCQPRHKQNKWLDSLNIPNDSEHREVVIRIGKKRFCADGYDPQSRTVYEFYGDSWHGNPKFFSSTDTNLETRNRKKPNGNTYGYLYEKTLQKEKILKENGYNIVVIWESEWNNVQIN